MSNHRLTAPPPELQPFTRGLLFLFMSDSLTIVNCHVISRCASESSREKDRRVELLSARGRSARRVAPVRAKLAFNVSPALTKSRAWLCFGRASVLSTDLRYLFAIKTKKKGGRRMGRDSLTGLVHVAEKTGGGRGNTDWRAEDVFLSGAS